MDEMIIADIYQLKNPTKKDFTFRWNSRPFTVPARSHRLYPEPLARHGAKKIAEQLVRADHGDAAVIRKDLMEAEIKKICVLYQSTEIDNTDALQARIDKLNPEDEDEEDLTAEEEAELAAEEEAKKEELDAFSQLNSEEVAEQERLEALKENNPRGYRIETLSVMTKKELLVEAAKSEVEGVNTKSTNKDIVEAIIEAEF